MTADGVAYLSVSVAGDGRLPIALDFGKPILLKKAPYQTSFGTPAISPDRRTVAWLVMY